MLLLIKFMWLIEFFFSFLLKGIEASRLLESEGIQTHLTFVYRFSYLLHYLPIFSAYQLFWSCNTLGVNFVIQFCTSSSSSSGGCICHPDFCWPHQGNCPFDYPSVHLAWYTLFLIWLPPFDVILFIQFEKLCS